MAVEYEISSDVAVIKETGSVSQCARVTQMYSGQITYDDEAGSKFATATINGKSQRVMLCIAVNGTVNYDDVPSLYSTVDGHRCLNIVTPTETGTPDDVPSLYETVVIDGQNVRAVRCIMINKTPVYDGVSSVCTFTGDDGKTHTAQLVNKITGGSVQVIIKGTSPLVLPDAIANSLSYVKAFGGTRLGLPADYTQLEYIEASGTQHIRTGVLPTSATKVEAVFLPTDLSSTQCLIGARNAASGSDRKGFAIWQNVGSAMRFDYQSDAVSGGTPSSVTWNTVIKSAQQNFLNDTRLNANSAADFVCDNDLAIFGVNTNGSIGNKASGRIKSVKIWKDGIDLSAYFVPAKRNSDNAIGMYDMLSGVFFANSGTGDFTAGATVTAPTPDAPIDIVSNNGVLLYSRNLLDPSESNIFIGESINTQGQSTTAANNWRTSYIPVIGGKTYVFFGRGKVAGTISAYARINFYTSDKTPITPRPSYTQDTPTVATAPSNAAYVRLSCAPFNSQDPVTREVFDRFNWTFADAAQEIPYQPYVEGGVYAAGPVETINMHGKNLFDKNTMDTGHGWYLNSSNVVAEGSALRTIVIDCKPNTKYSFWHTAGVGQAGAFVMDTNTIQTGDAGTLMTQSPSSMANANVVVTTYTTPANAKKLYIVAGNTSNGRSIDDQLADLMVVEGTVATATEYEPYFDGGTATAEMLLKVGDYQDVQSILDGVVTRNVGVKVFDGTEDFSFSSSSRAYLLSFPLAYNPSAPSDTLVCTSFVPSSAANANMPNGTVKLAHGTNNAFFVFKYTNVSSANAFKSWLADQYAAGTPVIVVYPLATPTTESVAGQTLQVQDGDNTLEITQAGMDGLELEVQYNAAVTLTVQEVEDANLDNNVTVTIQ